MRTFKFVDVSGVGNAGKGAVVDFLRALPGFSVPHYSFEFDFFRVPGGILDLEHHLVRDWSPIRSDRAIKDFRRVAQRMGLNPRWYDVKGQGIATGQRYDRRFKGQFLKSVDQFLESFVAVEYLTNWSYEYLSSPWTDVLRRKILSRLKLFNLVRYPVFITKDADFRDRVTWLINRIFEETTPEGATHVVFNNAFEPFNPVRGLDLLRESRSIIVYRDPRDVFVSGLTKQKANPVDWSLQSHDNNGVNRSFLGADDVEVFSTRYKTFLDRVYRGSDPRVLKIRFEEFVLDHERQKKRVLEFLGLDPELPISQEFFSPDRSKENIGKWKRYSNGDEVAYIAKRLANYLYA